MKINQKKLGIAVASCLAMGSYAVAAPGGGHGGGGGAGHSGFGGSHGNSGFQGFPGNSAFGRSQGGNPQIGSSNSAFGRAKAHKHSHFVSNSDKRTDRHGNKVKTKKAKKAKHHVSTTAPGNSAFGHSQGGNPRTGSVNSEFGQTTAANARAAAADRKSANANVTTDTTVKENNVSDTGVEHRATGNSAFGHNQEAIRKLDRPIRLMARHGRMK